MKGKFVLFEGCDGSGKTTQARLLQESGLLGETVGMRFPDRTTTVGKLCDEYLKKSMILSDEVKHLLFTANRWELADDIKKTLENGKSIVCDRYYYSGAAYSAFKGLSLEWCLAPEKGLPEPDLVIFIDINPEKLVQRAGFGEEVYEKVDVQKKVRELFLSMKKDNWRIIDGSKSLEEVTVDINRTVKEFFHLE